MSTFQDRICQALADAGMTQVDLAKRMRRERALINGWVKGRVSNPQLENVQRAAACLDVNTEWLMTGKGPKARSESGVNIDHERVIATTDVVDSALAERGITASRELRIELIIAALETPLDELTPGVVVSLIRAIERRAPKNGRLQGKTEEGNKSNTG